MKSTRPARKPVIRPPMWPAAEMPGTANVKTKLSPMTGTTWPIRPRPRWPSRKPTATSAPNRPKIAPLAPSVAWS